MNLYQRFKTNNDLEGKKGVTLDYGEGVKITILRAGGSNRKYQQVLREKLMATGRKLSSMTDEESEKGMIEVYADAVIIGWEGVKDQDGNDVPFTRENVVKIMSDLPELFADIQRAAGGFELFREAQKADLVGK